MTDAELQDAIKYNRERPYTPEQWEAIKAWLTQRGHSVETRSNFALAVALFQYAHGLVPDGKLGPRTEAEMVAEGLVLHHTVEDTDAACAEALERGDHVLGAVLAERLDELREQDSDSLEHVEIIGDVLRVREAVLDFDVLMATRGPAPDDGPLWDLWKSCLKKVLDHTDELARRGIDVRQHGGYNPERAVEWAREQCRDWRELLDRAWRTRRVKSYWGDDTQLPNWCGAFVASAHEAGGLEVPPGVRRGAKKYVKWLAKEGQWVYSPKHIKRLGRLTALDAAMLRPGDVLCWDRGPLPWMGHDSLLLAVHDDGSIEIAEGNATDPETGERGQLVHQVLGPDEWPKRLKGLWGVARP